jgi:Domain of unknown function (DUF6362)
VTREITAIRAGPSRSYNTRASGKAATVSLHVRRRGPAACHPTRRGARRQHGATASWPPTSLGHKKAYRPQTRWSGRRESTSTASSSRSATSSGVHRGSLTTGLRPLTVQLRPELPYQLPFGPAEARILLSRDQDALAAPAGPLVRLGVDRFDLMSFQIAAQLTDRGWLRAEGLPWKRITYQFGIGRTTAWQRWTMALLKITTWLNAADEQNRLNNKLLNRWAGSVLRRA